MDIFTFTERLSILKVMDLSELSLHIKVNMIVHQILLTCRQSSYALFLTYIGKKRMKGKKESFYLLCWLFFFCFVIK